LPQKPWEKPIKLVNFRNGVKNKRVKAKLKQKLATGSQKKTEHFSGKKHELV
jgi:hypothetical protein